MQYEIDHCLRSLKSTFVVNVFHISGLIFTLKNKFLQENIFIPWGKQFSKRIYIFGISYRNEGFFNPIEFEQNPIRVLEFNRKS